MQLRPYQREAINALMRGWDGGDNRQAVVLATGSGKTVIFSHLVFEMRKYGARRALVIAHREELLDQAADKIKRVAPHLKVGVYQGSRKQHQGKDVVVASVQTLGYRRPCMNKIVNEDGSVRTRCGECTRCGTLVNASEVGQFDLVIVDECHHAASQSYRRVLRHFGAWSGVPVAGFTATMTRQQGGLDKVWHDVAYTRDISEMISDGYLVPPRGKQVVIKDMDLDQAKVTAGDFTTKSLSDLMLGSSAMTDIAAAYSEHAADRPGIVFCPTVAVAHEMTDAFKAEGISAAAVWGAMSSDERSQTLERFSSGEVQVLVNCMVLCLDEETEILTSNGWVGPDEMTKQHRVANWDQGRVFFTEPKEVIVRPRAEWEDMYTLETNHRSIRVTGGHRMLYRTYDNGQYKKAPVEELANKRLRLPTTGWAEPEHPSKLTLDQAALVGFWIGDGTKARPSRGGVSYVISQSYRYSAIIEWFDGVLGRTGIQARRYDKRHYTVPHVRWALPRGTGGKGQKRQGVKEFEEYLDKDGSDLLWNLDAKQFDALLTGLWYADGNHGLAEDGRPDSFWISGSRKHLFDKLQAIASVRGWTTHLYKETAPRSERHKQMWRLSFHQRAEHKIGGYKPEYRIQREDAPHKEERAWCVKTDTKNIITRRRGTVTVMGNTEGFDEPKASCLVVARPTKNHGLYIQMVGRVLRLSPETGKTDALILDVTGATTRHKLASVSDLSGKKKQRGTKFGEVDDEPDGTEVKPVTEAGLQIEKELLDIGGWKDVDLMAKESGVRWLRSPGGYRFVLADERAYFTVPGIMDGQYHIRMVHKGVPVVPPGDPSDTLEKAVAELERIGAAKAGPFDNVAAGWRRRRVSEKLKRFAEKLKVEVAEGATAGQVSDAIYSKKVGRQVDNLVEEHERRLKEARGV